MAKDKRREEDRLLIEPQARSKQCLIGPAITKLSAGDLGAVRGNLSGHISGIQMHFKKHSKTY